MVDHEALLPESEPRPRRLPFVDVARGVTMAVMLVVDVAGDAFPSWMGHGDGFAASSPSVHLADYVMPSFLFLSGFSSVLSSQRDSRNGDGTWKTFERAVKLFALGIAVQGKWLPDTPGRPDVAKTWTGLDLGSFRVMGILQRVALCNLFCSILIIKVRNIKQQAAVVSFVLVAFAVLTYVPAVPGCPHAGMLSMTCNTAGWFDTVVFGDRHVYINSTQVLPPDSSEPTAAFGFDPEGLLTTLGAACTTYFGSLCAQRLLTPHKGRLEWREELYVGSIVGFCVGILLYSVAQIPINKKLWTLSYMALTTGVSAFVLALTHDLCAALRFADGAEAGLDNAGERREGSEAMDEETARGEQEARCDAGQRREERACDGTEWWAGAGRAVAGWLEGLGANPLLFFVGSDCCGVLSIAVGTIKVCAGPRVVGESPRECWDLVRWWRVSVLQRWLLRDAGLGDLVYALVQLALWVWICRWLCDRRWFFKL